MERIPFDPKSGKVADGKIRRVAHTLKMLVPVAGIEPARAQGPEDFESLPR